MNLTKILLVGFPLMATAGTTGQRSTCKQPTTLPSFSCIQTEFRHSQTPIAFLPQSAWPAPEKTFFHGLDQCGQYQQPGDATFTVAGQTFTYEGTYATPGQGDFQIRSTISHHTPTVLGGLNPIGSSTITWTTSTFAVVGSSQGWSQAGMPPVSPTDYFVVKHTLLPHCP